MVFFFFPQVCRSEDFFEDFRFYSGALDTLTGLVLIPVSPRVHAVEIHLARMATPSHPACFEQGVFADHSIRITINWMLDPNYFYSV